MAYLYFDESIRDNGGFIIGAMVISKNDLSPQVRETWRSMDLDPDIVEYKSSHLKHNDGIGQQQRDKLGELLFRSRLALTVCPSSDRKRLGGYCLALTNQLLNTGLLHTGTNILYVDDNIKIPKTDLNHLLSRGTQCHPNQDSLVTAGLQVADHAAHALGGMLLEEMGVVRKSVRAGEDSGYDPDLKIELGFELWASLRYALLGNNEEIDGLSTPGDPANPYFRVDGYGLYIAPSCGEELAMYARNRFGVNYLGCIH